MSYTIQKGDRLGSLAKQYNTTVDELMALNPQITNPNKIYAGDTLNLPGQVQTIEPIEVVESAGGAPAAAAAVQNAQSNEYLNQLLALSMGGGGSGSSGIASAYNNAISSYQASVQAMRDYLTQYQADQNAQIADAYELARRQAYVNGRLNAVGNNEVLASMGLSGNLYDTPQSGYTETARVAENLQMRNAIADANTQEQADVNALAMEIMKQNADLDMETAQYVAQMQIQMAQAQAEYEAQQYANQVAALQAIMNQQNIDREYALAEQQFAFEQQQYAEQFAFEQQQYADAQAAAAAQAAKSSSGSRRSTPTVTFEGLVNDVNAAAKTYGATSTASTQALANNIIQQYYEDGKIDANTATMAVIAYGLGG